MATAVFDQSLDLNGQELHRIINLYGAPDYVKEASADRLCGEENLPPHMYADPVRKLYPCHTAPAVWASTAFFSEKRASLPNDQAAKIQQRLGESARYFAIEGDVGELKAKVARALSTDTGALPDELFAIVRVYEDGRKERLYPMRNSTEVQKAAEYLETYRDQLRYADRRKVADKILQKAAEYGANVRPWQGLLEKTAGLGACSSTDAAELVRSRARILKSHERDLQEELEKLAAQVEEAGELFKHFAPLDKLASIVDQFDHERGLHQGYRQGMLDRPEDVLFGVTEKVAMDLSQELVENPRTGNIYKRADLENLNLRTLGDAMGAEFVGAVSTANAWIDMEKLSEIVPTLPLDDAETFDGVLAAMGIAPFATKMAEAAPQGLQPDEREALAAQHTPAAGGLWGRIQRQGP